MALTDINYSLLRRVRDTIVDDPMHFDMSSWYFIPDQLTDIIDQAGRDAEAAGEVRLSPDWWYPDHFDGDERIAELPSPIVNRLPTELTGEWCGTTACIAGHAILFAHEISSHDLRAVTGEVLQRYRGIFPEEGARVLGLPNTYVAMMLFDKANWPWPWLDSKTERDVSENEYAVALLDGILCGEIRLPIGGGPEEDLVRASWDYGDGGFAPLSHRALHRLQPGDLVTVATQFWAEGEDEGAEGVGDRVRARITEAHHAYCVAECEGLLHPEQDDTIDFSWKGPMRFWRRGNSLVSFLGFCIVEVE